MELIKRLDKKLHLKKVSCIICGKTIKDGMIFYKKEYNVYFILQNDIYGISTAPDIKEKYGYKCAWSGISGSSKDLERASITNIILLKTTPNIIEVW